MDYASLYGHPQLGTTPVHIRTHSVVLSQSPTSKVLSWRHVCEVSGTGQYPASCFAYSTTMTKSPCGGNIPVSDNKQMTADKTIAKSTRPVNRQEFQTTSPLTGRVVRGQWTNTLQRQRKDQSSMTSPGETSSTCWCLRCTMGLGCVQVW
ncbi:hypothetical protein BaRGS_00029053 [Batillaria attramentaria]|uniref:Uncharacterized protein n=1 Tax=Batillaria attramentaria TaxID=370345 RepID=A0ABD0JX56_9CAEN